MSADIYITSLLGYHSRQKLDCLFLLFRKEVLMAAVTWLSHKSEKFVPEIEKTLGKDLKGFPPPPCQLLPPESMGIPTGSLLPRLQQTHGEPPLLYIYFKGTTPRLFEMQGFLKKARLATTLQRLIYAVPLVKPVRGPVRLGEQKSFGSSPFEGEAEAALLNERKDLLKLANKLACTSVSYGNVMITISRYLVIQPASTGSLLVLHTLPRLQAFGWTLLAGEVMDLATMIEAAL
jgi:hypothetical protein